jgi:hypothetical protein
MNMKSLALIVPGFRRRLSIHLLLALLLPWTLLKAEPVHLQPAPSPADNPLKGLVPYANHARKGESHFPHSLEFDYLPLAKLMPGQSRFDWEPLDALLNKIATRGNQAVFRIWIEYPGQQSGLPDYLRELGVKVTSWSNPDEKKTCYSPDYEDERLVSALEAFITALGQRYDGDPRIGFITAGLLGSWGEWHTYPREDLFASPKTQRRVLEAYEKAFNQSPILLRYPVGKGDEHKAANAHYHMGFHDDSFAWGTLDRGQKDDWFFMPLLKKAGAAALNKWRTQPIGGEVRPELWGQIFDAKPAHPKAQDFAECVRQTHVSWLMESGMFKEQATAARYASAVAHVQRMGYDFHVATAEITRASSKVQLRVTVLNQGVAPFYQDWRLELAALGADGKIAHRWPVDWKLTGLLPGDAAREWQAALNLPPESLAGRTLALRVIHPLPHGKPLRFANAEQDRHAPGWLSLGTLP